METDSYISPKLKKKRISNLRYRNSEAGHRTHRIWSWKNSLGIVGDLNAYYAIIQNTHYCDFCHQKLAYRGSKPASNSKTLDHCHSCGLPRGVLCNSCNLANKLKCELCD